MSAKVGKEQEAGFVVNVQYKKIFLFHIDFLLFSVHLFKNCKCVFHVTVGGGFGGGQVVLKC